MKTWQNWFAWYPVAFGPHIKWMCTIQRYYDDESRCWIMRRLPDVNCTVPHVRKQPSLWATLKTIFTK